MQLRVKVISRLRQNAEDCHDLGHLSNLLYILYGHFDEKKKKVGVPAYTGGKEAVKIGWWGDATRQY